MSDDELDLELLELLRQSLGISSAPQDEISADTGVLKDAEFIYNNGIDVSIDMYGTRNAAANVYTAMRERGYSMQTWGEHELHPKLSEGRFITESFVQTQDCYLYKSSFWSEKHPSERFQVEYRGQRWTGYNSLVACLRRALDNSIAITTPQFWNDECCSDELLRDVFRSATDEHMPLLDQRIAILREAGEILHEVFGEPAQEAEPVIAPNNPDDAFASYVNGSVISDGQTNSTIVSNGAISAGEFLNNGVSAELSADGPIDDSTHVSDTEDSAAIRNRPVQEGNEAAPLQQSVQIEAPTIDLTVVRLIEKADSSAGKLVNLLVKYFPSFRDETRFEAKRVRIFKRAQILVADLWAAFQGASYGAFDDISSLTMFADYRVPQMLNALGILTYSPPLLNRVRSSQIIEHGHSWEVQLRGCSIWAVELIRREIVRAHPEASADVNAVLIDFFLYDLAKEREAAGELALTDNQWRRPGCGSGACQLTAETDAQPMLPHHRTRSVWY